MNCYECVHHRRLPGDAHISCVHRHAVVRADPAGIQAGWCFWPLNFDPQWVRECNSFSADEKDRYTGVVGPDAHALMCFLAEHGIKVVPS